MNKQDENKSGFSLSGMGLVVALLLAAGLFFGGMQIGEHKQAPRTTPGPGPTSPSGRVAIEGTSAHCTYCSLHDGDGTNDYPVMTDGTTDDGVKCKRTSKVDVSLLGKLSGYSASAKKLVADALSKEIGSDANLMKVSVTDAVDLDSDGRMHVVISNQDIKIYTANGPVDVSKFPANVRKCVDDAGRDLNVKPNDYSPGVKDHKPNIMHLGNQECVETITWPAQ